MKAKKVIAPKVSAKEAQRVSNPFIPEVLTRKQVTEKMETVNKAKKSITDLLKEERSFYGCLRFIYSHNEVKEIADFFDSINSDFHKVCVNAKKEVNQESIALFNSLKSAKLIEKETLKPKVSYSVNYIIEVFRANYKSTLESKIKKVSKIDATAKIAKLQAEIAKLQKVA